MNELQTIGKKIITLPGRPLFMLDSDVAELYGIETKELNRIIKRHPERFPDDFVFELTTEEVKEVVTKWHHLQQLKFRPTLPFGITHEAANALSFFVNTEIAIERSFLIVRAFTAIERFAPQRLDTALVDAPDCPLLPSGNQVFAFLEVYSKEEVRQILKDYCGIYPGGLSASITPIEQRIIRKNNPNKAQRNECMASLFDRGISRAMLSLASGMSEKSIHNCISAGRKCAGYKRRINASER